MLSSDTVNCIVNSIVKLSVTSCIIAITCCIYSLSSQFAQSTSNIEQALVNNTALLSHAVVNSAQQFGDNVSEVANSVAAMADAATNGGQQEGVNINVNIIPHRPQE